VNGAGTCVGSRWLTPGRRPERSGAGILICDERPLTRLTLSQTIGAIASLSDIGCVSDGFALADAFAAKPADLVLIGYQVGRVGGAQATELLLSLYPSAAVIAFGSPDASGTLAEAVARGARGLMLWDPDRRHRPLTGPDGWTARWPGRARSSGDGIDELTERELQILRGMSQGMSNAEIGRELFLSEDTIKTHARRLFQKLGARDRAHAVAMGMRNKLVA
jgi:DNA-binding NarL/FixJ family response regulator